MNPVCLDSNYTPLQHGAWLSTGTT